MYRGLMLSLALVCCDVQGTYAQSNNKIQDAIRVIVMLCVAGGERVEVSGTATGDGGLALKKQNGAGSPDVTFSRSEGMGLVDGIRREMSSISANQASEARKCMQPYIDRIIDIILSDTPSLSLPPTSTWSHNNSLMSATITAGRVSIYYQQPRQGMIDEGVRPGTLLFDGRRTGNRVSGTSYVFDRRCGKIPYPDDGEISGPNQIALNGRRVPTQLGTNCEVLDFRIDPSFFYRLN